jgi:hypothetical protein
MDLLCGRLLNKPTSEDSRIETVDWLIQLTSDMINAPDCPIEKIDKCFGLLWNLGVGMISPAHQDYQSAVFWLRKALQFGGSNATTTRPLADLWRAVGLVHLKAGELRQSRQAALKASELEKASSPSLEGLLLQVNCSIAEGASAQALSEIAAIQKHTDCCPEISSMVLKRVQEVMLDNPAALSPDVLIAATEALATSLVKRKATGADDIFDVVRRMTVFNSLIK